MIDKNDYEDIPNIIRVVCLVSDFDLKSRGDFYLICNISTREPKFILVTNVVF